MYQGLINKYREFLPLKADTEAVTLQEGNTPLIKLKNFPLAKKLNIYAKYEGLNPTGSFKDRGMTMAITKAVEDGSKAVICASTGNTSASAAAYAARAGLKTVVIIPEGKIALGKLSQALMHGAKVIEIDGNFDRALEIVRELGENYPITIVNSINPYRIEGQKTGSFEIIEQLGKAPDYHAIPVGNAGNITAYWKGYKEWQQSGKIDKLPKMIGFQAAGSAPIVEGKKVEKPETIATAIRIGNPASWQQAEAARDESGGLIEKVTDEEITEAQKLLASTNGIFCEPASAASLAGVIKKDSEGYFQGDETVVCILTGHGLKDPNRAIEIAGKTYKSSSDIEQIVQIIGF